MKSAPFAACGSGLSRLLCLTPWVTPWADPDELRKTGQQATVAGYPAIRYDLLEDGKAASELWIAKGITAWRELDGKKLERFMAEMAKLAGCSSQERRGAPGADQSWKLAGEGYPVRTVERSVGTTVTVINGARGRDPLSAKIW